MVGGVHAVLAAAALTAVAWLHWSVSPHSRQSRNLPCPDPADIAPCYCVYYGENYDMDMNCSAVTSSEQLAQVFSAHLPFPDFYALYIKNNMDILAIHEGDLGVATFKWIDISYGALDVVHPQAFANSYSTLTTLLLNDNVITLFPYHEISEFTELLTLSFARNHLRGFPKMDSNSLIQIFYGENPVQWLNASDFQGLPNLFELGLMDTMLEYVSPGTFANLTKLELLHLEDNELMILEKDTVQMFTSNSEVHLYRNGLTEVEAGAIQGVKEVVEVSHNQLQEITQDVWEPIFMDVNLVRLDDNPLLCGCEMAWLVLNEDYMTKLSGQTKCSDGELVSGLDPGIYQALC